MAEVNNVNGGIEIIRGDDKTMFPKEDTRVELVDDRVIIKDISPEAGETVTLDFSIVTSPSLATNALLYAAIRDMVYGAPLYAAISAVSSNNTIVAATAGKKIRVLSVFGLADTAGTARFESNSGGAALTGQVDLGVTGGYVLAFNPLGHFETTAGHLLNLELIGITAFNGSIVYELI